LAEIARQETAQREGITPRADAKGKIIEFMWILKKQGYSEQTIRSYVTLLNTFVAKGVDILDPEDVKKAIAARLKHPTTQWNYCNFYDSFVKHMKMTWEKPLYKPREKIPFIPTEQELDQLISSTGWKISVILQIAKETAMRIGEILRLRWENVDPQRRVIIIDDPEKGSKPGISPITQNLIERILRLPKTTDRIFGTTKVTTATSTLTQARKRIAQKLNNPRLLRITFHTFRHWKATVEYHKTKDILHVQELFRHRNIRNTLVYITLEKGLFGQQCIDEYHVKVADNVEEAIKLVEVGFEYVTGDYGDGGKIFRKRK
jgi:integrase